MQTELARGARKRGTKPGDKPPVSDAELLKPEHHLAPLANIAVTTVSALLRRDVLKGRIQCKAQRRLRRRAVEGAGRCHAPAAPPRGFTVTRKARR